LEFQNIHRQEIYKWQAAKHFQENFDLNSRDFPKMVGNVRRPMVFRLDKFQVMVKHIEGLKNTGGSG